MPSRKSRGGSACGTRYLYGNRNINNSVVHWSGDNILTPHRGGSDPFADTKLGNALSRAIVDTIHEPFLVLDTNSRVVVASRSFYEKFKVDKEVTQGKLFYEIGNGQWNIASLRNILEHIITKHEVMEEFKIEHNFPDLGPRTMLLSAREITHEQNQRKHLLLTIVDISERELLDIEKAKLSRQKDLMMQEMKHRMANSLQLIASILILKSETVESLEARSHLRDAHERILSIATIEKHLDTMSLSEEVEVGSYLTGLCTSLSNSMIGNKKPVILKVEAVEGMATSAEGISLGLITAELVINALKHAFPQGRKGSILVVYTVAEGGWQLAVSDNGVGINIDPFRKEGLGTTIVRSLARQLGALVETQSNSKGTRVSIVRGVLSGTLPQLL